MERGWRLEESGKKPAFWRQNISNFNQTAANVIGVEMGENRNSQRIVKSHAELSEIKSVGDPQVWLLPGIERVLEQLFLSGFDEGRIEVDPKIMVFFKVGDKIDSAAQTAAANIGQAMVGRQTAVFEEFILQRTNFIPHSADKFAMLAGTYGGVGQCSSVFVLKRLMARGWRTLSSASQQAYELRFAHGPTMAVNSLASSEALLDTPRLEIGDSILQIRSEAGALLAP